MADDVSNDEKIAQAAWENSNIQRIYTNGFVIGISQADLFVVLQSGTTSTTIIQMSFNLAKALGISLMQNIKGIETATGQEFLTTQEIRQRVEEFGKANSK